MARRKKQSTSSDASVPPNRTNPSLSWLPNTNRLADSIRILFLLAITALAWCAVNDRWSSEAWQIPLEYGVAGPDADAQAVMAVIKAASEGDFAPFQVAKISRLGAPYYGNWSDFPIIEEWQFFLPGLLARLIGVFAAANAAVLFAHLAASACFYLSCRLLRCHWAWAFCGSLAFGLAPFAFARSLHHLQVTHYWYIPLCIVISWWISRNEFTTWRGRRYYFCLGTAFFVGMQNPYYTNMFLQLVCLGAVVQYFRGQSRVVWMAGGIVAASAFGFLLMNIDSILYRLEHGANPGSALKPIDMFIPLPGHRFESFSKFGEAYYKMVAFPGEVPASCYLGLAGISALFWLGFVSARNFLKEKGAGIPLEAWQVLWVTLYSVVGGLNCLAGIFGVVMFRSSTRYCIFILAIVLLFAVRRLSAKTRPAWISVSAAILCLTVVLVDQLPKFADANRLQETAKIFSSDAEYAREIESRLPKGAMIFQIPVMEFPESPAQNISSSDHFRPYLHSKDLKISFGAMKGRPWQEWQKELAQKDLEGAIRMLQAYGFSAISITRNGMPDKGDGIIQGLRKMGYSDTILSPMGDLVCVFIHPNSHPILPSGKIK